MPETILIVDDHASTVRTLSDLLDEQGYSVRSAKTGETALAEVESNPIGLALVAARLQDMSGFKLAPGMQAAARRSGPGTLPLIFIIDAESTKDRIRAFDAGGVDYITRPLQSAEALARVNTHLNTGRLTQALRNAWLDLERRVEERNSELNRQVQLFRKFVPQTFAQALDEASFDVTRGVSREENYSVLSCDIRSFTTFSESITSTECFRFLNSYFTVMEPGIRNHGGFIYQYVGDSIMALFPPDRNGMVDNVLESAIALHQVVIKRYNEGRAKAGYEPIRIGTGINTGSVAIGIAGTPERMDASAFGSTVNLAARCEELTKDTGADIILTQDTFERLADPGRYAIKSLGSTGIRGMSHPVELYQTTGYAS